MLLLGLRRERPCPAQPGNLHRNIATRSGPEDPALLVFELGLAEHPLRLQLAELLELGQLGVHVVGGFGPGWPAVSKRGWTRLLRARLPGRHGPLVHDGFQLPAASEAQLARIDQQLRSLELERAERIKAQHAQAAPPSPAHRTSEDRFRAGVPLRTPRTRGASYVPLLALLVARVLGADTKTAATVALVVAIALLLVQGWMVARRPSCAACHCSP